jgi:hypothetical protein
LDGSLNERIVFITQMAIIKLVFEILLFQLIDFVVIVKLLSFHFIFRLGVSAVLVFSSVIILADWVLILL